MSADFSAPFLGSHYAAVLRICLRLLGDPDDAADAAQETFRRALQQPPGRVTDELLWLKAVARNVCIDELRRRSRRERVEPAALATTTGAVAPDPEGVVVGRAQVRDLLERLSPAERQVMSGRALEGRSGVEMARSLGIASSTVRALLARARTKLRHHLEDTGSLGGSVGAAGWRLADRARSGLLGRPWMAQRRDALAMPAVVMSALVIAGAGSPHHGAGPLTPQPGGHATPALVALAGSRPDQLSRRPGQASPPSIPSPLVARGAAAVGRAVQPQDPPPPPMEYGRPFPQDFFPGDDVGMVYASEIAPSPTFASDHTAYMIGSGCAAGCSEMYRSTDGGATWAMLPAANLRSGHLLLPPSTYPAGRWYGWGGELLQETTDSGTSFAPAGVSAGLFALAPPGAPGILAEAEATLDFVDESGTRHIAGVFPPQYTAVSRPLFLASAGADFVALEVVENQVLGGDLVLRCTPSGCSQLTALPDMGTATLLPSPEFASDHTLVLVGAGVWVSHDGGHSFTQTDATQPVSQAQLVPGPHGLRLVGLLMDATGNLHLGYSDDEGATWQFPQLVTARPDNLYVFTIARLGPGRLIAQVMNYAPWTAHFFVCSADGSSWSPCAPM